MQPVDVGLETLVQKMLVAMEEQHIQAVKNKCSDLSFVNKQNNINLYTWGMCLMNVE